MIGYQPYRPTGDAKAIDWADRIHRAAFNRRRLIFNPGVLITQTSQGVFHRPKPDDWTGIWEPKPRIPVSPVEEIDPELLTNDQFRELYAERFGYGFFIAKWNIEKVLEPSRNRWLPPDCENCTVAGRTDGNGYVDGWSNDGNFGVRGDGVIHSPGVWNGSEYVSVMEGSITSQTGLIFEFIVEPAVTDNTAGHYQVSGNPWNVSFGPLETLQGGVAVLAGTLEQFLIGSSGVIQDSGRRYDTRTRFYGFEARFPLGMAFFLDRANFFYSLGEPPESLRLPACSVTLRGHYAARI